MLNNWLILVIISGLSSNFFNTILRRTLRDGRDSTAFGWWFELLRLIFFTLFLFWDYSLVVSPANLFWLLVLGLCEVIAVYTYMRMHSLTELSVSSIITRMRSIWVAALAFVMLGERLSPAQYIGVITVILGTLVVQSSYKFRFDKAMKIAIIFTFASAFSTIIMKHATTYASVSVINVAFSLPAVLLLPIMMKDPLSRLKATLPVTLKSNLAASLFNNITMFALVSALKLTNASQVTGVFQGVAMLAVVIGIFVLDEHDHKTRKLIAAAITTIGIMLLV